MWSDVLYILDPDKQIAEALAEERLKNPPKSVSKRNWLSRLFKKKK